MPGQRNTTADYLAGRDRDRHAGRHNKKQNKSCMYLSFAHRSLVPQQNVVRVGNLAHKLLPKPLGIDG